MVCYLLRISLTSAITYTMGSIEMEVDITDKTVTLTPSETLWGTTIVIGSFK